MPITELTPLERRLLKQEAGALMGRLLLFHDKWCDDPAEGSRYIACYRIMKMTSALEELMQELDELDSLRLLP